MKFVVNCPQNLEKVQKYAHAMDRSLRERAEFLTAAANADLLILFKPAASPDAGINAQAPGSDDCKAKITVACGEGIAGDLHCGLGADCDLTFSSLQKGRLQICLLRPVQCLDGHFYEPFEFPFRGSVGNAYPMLAAAAVKILCEVREPNRGLAKTDQNVESSVCSPDR